MPECLLINGDAVVHGFHDVNNLKPGCHCGITQIVNLVVCKAKDNRVHEIDRIFHQNDSLVAGRQIYIGRYRNDVDRLCQRCDDCRTVGFCVCHQPAHRKQLGFRLMSDLHTGHAVKIIGNAEHLNHLRDLRFRRECACRIE